MSAVTAKSAAAPLERYRAAFEARWQSNDALTELRRASLEQFLASGFPTQRHEDWKYTNLRRLETRTFSLAEKPSPPRPFPRPVSEGQDDRPFPRSAGEGQDGGIPAAQDRWIAHIGTRIVLVNGHWTPALSSHDAQPPGVTVLTLGQWLEHDPAAVAEFLSRHRPEAPSVLERLNTAFFEDGVVINLADGAQLDDPVYVVHQWSDGATQRMSHPRVIVRAGRNSRCRLIEHFLGPAEAECFTNAVTSIEVDAGGAVDHYRLQQESPRSFHIGHSSARLQSDSRYSCHDIALGASIGRLNIVTSLEGAGAHVALRGLFAPTGTQHIDAHTRIDHVAPRTTSEEDYRGIAAGKGRGVFNGKVIVRPGAQKIDARQSSRNLLLSPTAEIDTKPELEIYANDVKCSHGATTGQLDAAALFYLRSRGLSEADARGLLIRAFAESILSTVGHPALRSYLERQLNDRFAEVQL